MKLRWNERPREDFETVDNNLMEEGFSMKEIRALPWEKTYPSSIITLLNPQYNQ